MRKDLPKPFLDYIVNQHADPEAVWNHMQTQFAYALYTRLSNFVDDITNTISPDEFLGFFINGKYYNDTRLWNAENMTDMSIAGLWTAYDLLSQYFGDSSLNHKEGAGFQLRKEVAAAIVAYRAETKTNAPIAMIIDSSDGQFFGLVFNEEDQKIDMYDLEDDISVFCEATGVTKP